MAGKSRAQQTCTWSTSAFMSLTCMFTTAPWGCKPGKLFCGSNHEALPAVQSDIRREQRQIDKAIRDNDRLEKTAQKQIKEAAKRNDMTTAKVRLLPIAPAPVWCL